MKTWNKPEVEELNVNETAHAWFGFYQDGGYIGDGQISGHLSMSKPASETPATPETPVTPVDPVEALS